MSRPIYLLYKTYCIDGPPGNAFLIMGQHLNWMRELQKAVGLDQKTAAADKKAFQDEAMSGDYKHLQEVCTKWFGTEFVSHSEED